MTGLEITNILPKDTVHAIWSGLSYGTLTQEAAADSLKTALNLVEDQNIICDVSSTKKWNKEIVVNELFLSKDYIDSALEQIKEIFQQRYSKDQETSHVWRDTNRRGKQIVVQ